MPRGRPWPWQSDRLYRCKLPTWLVHIYVCPQSEGCTGGRPACGSRHPVTNDAHRAELRAAFGETLPDQFVDTMMGKLISGLRLDDILDPSEGTSRVISLAVSGVSHVRGRPAGG